MPSFKITIYQTTENKMEGEKWHPSHDLEKVKAHYTKLAIDTLGKSMVKMVEVIMTDNDAPKTQKNKKLISLNPVEKRKHIYIEKLPLKERIRK
ncbi:MAG: hypothetical protein NVS1B13_24920 [Flavisolibacter sp.]